MISLFNPQINLSALQINLIPPPSRSPLLKGILRVRVEGNFYLEGCE